MMTKIKKPLLRLSQVKTRLIMIEGLSTLIKGVLKILVVIDIFFRCLFLEKLYGH